jgi:glycine betaine/proline transport system substrate-binding protein
MNWASAAVVTSISKFLMEQGYGCTVTVVPSSSVTAVASMAETGEPDILTELWKTATPAYGDLEDAGKVTTLKHAHQFQRLFHALRDFRLGQARPL